MRYTEARLTRMAEDMLANLNENTVDFIDNFDGSLKEPSVLPSELPNLLLNGSSGIAVGMATNIPPHNLGELVRAISYLIEKYGLEEGGVNIDDVTVEELMQFLPGPDFPTGGVIVGTEGIYACYASSCCAVIDTACGRASMVLSGVCRRCHRARTAPTPAPSTTQTPNSTIVTAEVKSQI
jgi:DNA gyrase subunit A